MAIKIVFDSELCDGCGVCVWACHRRCIKGVHNHAMMRCYPVLNLGTCTGCGKCAAKCAKFANKAINIQVVKEQGGDEEN